MTNRCAPGDLAITFEAPMDNGLLVEVLSIAGKHPVYGQLMLVISLGSPFHIDHGVFSQRAHWPDRMLRPLRDPGDDAIDWISHRRPRSVDLRQDQLTRARAQLLETTS